MPSPIVVHARTHGSPVSMTGHEEFRDPLAASASEMPRREKLYATVDDRR